DVNQFLEFHSIMGF
ncbi:unnamed protein product, partial [Adineta steineri]